MQTRLLLTALVSILLLASCKKTIDKKKQDLVIAAMTTGTWYVQEYKVGTTDVTAEFDGYDFQFDANGTVHGIKNLNTISGTWEGDANARTINSNFYTAPAPLSRLTGLWKLTDNDWVYVHANCVIGGETCYLKLRKK